MTDPNSGSPNSVQARRLPTYRALLAVDVRDFSGYDSSEQAALTARIRPIVRAAFHRCGLGDVWDEELWQRVIGDSYVAAFPSTVLPFLLNPLLRALQEQLEEENRQRPVGYPARPIRMRTCVHVGPVTDACPADPATDGSGDARIEAHRLLDADRVKDILNRSDEDTCVAAIVSERVYADAIESGYAGEPKGRYRPVDVTVKQYRGKAYLRVLEASGDLLDRGLGTAPDNDAERAESQNRSGQESPHTPHSDRSVTGIGSVGGSARNVVTGTHGPVHIGRDADPDDDERRSGRGPAS